MDDIMDSSSDIDMQVERHAPRSGPMWPLDYVAQSLQCRLGNPNNRCFANAAFRLWPWAGAFMDGPKLWSKTTTAVLEALKADEVVHLPKLPGLEVLWEKFDDNKQDDASHFLQELVAIAETDHVIQSYRQVDYRQEVQQHKAFPVHLLFHASQGPGDLEHLIAEWANTAEGQVFDGQGLWVAQIGRYEQVQGTWTKHHRALQVPSIFNLPVTLDGEETRMLQYSLIGFLCHSGTAHQEGHFFAVFIYRGLYWLVDDGAYPRPFQHLSETTQQQIVQVWAIPSRRLLPAHIECDVTPGRQRPMVPEQASKRQCTEGIQFDFANITQLGHAVRQWIITRPRKPLFMVETHLGAADFEKTQQWLVTRGLNMLGEPAAETVKGGTNGGFMMVYPPNQHFHFVQKQVIDGCGWYGVSWTFGNSELILVMSYFKCGEGMQGPCNSRLWAGLLAFVTSLQRPVIVFGDFNIPPEVFMTTTMAQVMHVQILATGQETCNTGNELDWAFVSTQLIADMTVQTDWMVPFKPHAMLRFQLAGHFEDVVARQLSKYGPAPKLSKPEKEWHHFETRQVKVNWLNKETDNLTSQTGSLYDRIERFVLQQLDKPTTGRGTTLQYVHRPIADPSKPWLWRKGSLAFWGQIEIRLQRLLRQSQREPRHQTGLQKLGWHIDENWHPDAPVTCEGYMMLFEMLWHQHGDEHIHVLLNYTTRQRELHQQESFQQETEEYRQWLAQATQKGCRGLYRTLKKDELPYMRPFQDQPRSERMAKRVQQWGDIWQTQDQPVLIASMEQMIQRGQAAAQQLPPLTEAQIWYTIKQLALKAPGLDGIGFDFLKALPFSAMADLKELFHQIEAAAMIPSQWGTSLIALLPKSQVIERPIALVATLYRLWCRLRNGQTKLWAQRIQDEYPWERAVPGTECLQVALKRAFMTEHHQAHRRTVVSVLLDLSNFYDRINLQKLANRWLDSSYPATHAALAMQVYAGSRILEAEGEASEPLWASHGILAGDPQAPLAAKVYLQRALREFSRRFPQLHTDLWIDDLSFDVVDKDPYNAVRIAIQAYEFVKTELEKDNLKVSAQKTGFIVSNAAVKKILQEQLPKGGPRVHDVMRDLGVDCTAGRLRRIQTVRARRTKAARKTRKLMTLKIPERAIRLKLYKGSIVAGISWGHEAMGIAPQVRRRLRATMGRQMGLQKTGNIDILFDMQKQHRDPDYGAFEDQVRLYRRFFGNWPEHLARDLEKAWNFQKEKLRAAKHPWQHAKGPVAALQCYLMEHGRQCDRYDEWTKPGHNGEPECRLNMHADWFFLKQELARAKKWETVMKVSQRTFLQEVQQPLDWLPWRRMSRQLSKPQNTALQTWHQGAIFTRSADGQEGKHLMCPHCHTEATPIHLLWVCPQTQKQFAPLDQLDKQEIEHGINLEFWAQGLLQLPQYEISTGGAAVQTWGSWTINDEVRLGDHDMVTIGIAPTSHDPRLKHFVVALVHHTHLNGDLFRKGAVTTVLPGKQSIERAWFYGLRLIAHYLDLSKKVVVQVLSVRAWEAWVKGRRAETFFDLNNLVTADQRQRIQPLSLTLKQVNEMPKGVYTVRARLRDATKAAKEVAMSLRPHHLEEELHLTDQRYQKIAPLAIKRIRYLLETKDHFLHQTREAGKTRREQTRAKKTQLFLDLGNHHTEYGHSWEKKGIGLQCTKCKVRITKHCTVEDLEKAKTETCSGAAKVDLVGGKSPEVSTKEDLIHQMVAGELPQMESHKFEVQKHYIVCTACKGRILRNSAREKLLVLAEGPCWNKPWPIPSGWLGHTSHKMWRQGGKVYCTQCKAHATNRADSYQASKGLRQACGEQATQTTLPSCFKTKKV